MRFAYVEVRLYYKIVEDLSIAFGPVPSRRLGWSFGLDNIPPKFCTYICIYCQVGKTLNMTSNRRAFYEPSMIFNEVKEKVKRCATSGEAIDYITFVPQGEPTLDVNLGVKDEVLVSADRPTGEDAFEALFDKAGEDFGVLDRLLKNGSIKRVYYEGKAYYVRNYKQNVN